MVVKRVDDLKIKIFADGAEKAGMLELAKLPHIKGFTTNPTLMKKAGVSDYAAFAKDILSVIKDRPVSFEVFSDDFSEMERQADIIASWAPNVYVKIPITNTRGESAIPLVQRLSARGIKLNVTAILTINQVREVVSALSPTTPSFVSVFAGRIADTGLDPIPIMREAREIVAANPAAELIWCSSRELLNIFQAEEVGCHIITVTNDILKKLNKVGYDLEALSLDTVKMFYDDGQKAGYELRDVTGSMYREYIDQYFSEAKEILDKIDRVSICQTIGMLADVRREKGRLFILGVGGGAGNASHAVNDFRKLAGIEAYAPTDNVPELTARTNDDGWQTIFARWLAGSNLTAKDAVLVFSVGGGNAEKNVSPNIVEALKYAKQVGAKVIGVVGRDGGYTRQVADACIVVPVVNSDTVTPHTESFQALIWHLIVSHPKFKVQEGKWETVGKVGV